MSFLNNKPLVRGKLSPAAQKRGFARGSIFKKRAPAKIAQRVFREEGEKALSWQSPGGALTTFELGNGTWRVPFPDRARSLPRENASIRAKPRGTKRLAKFAPLRRGAGKPCLRHDLEAKAWFCSRKKFKRKGLPQKSRSEFCGKRSSEHRSKAARNTAACEICSAATRAPAKILRSKRSAGMKMQRRRLKVGAAARSLFCRRTFSRRRFIR